MLFLSWTETITLQKPINKNTKLQHTAHAHQPPTNSHIPQAQQGRAIQNKKQHLPLNEYIEEFYQEKVSRTDHEQKKDKTKRANGLGRRTREELKKKTKKSGINWQTRDSRQRGDIGHSKPPIRPQWTENKWQRPQNTDTIKQLQYLLNYTMGEKKSRA